MKALFLIRHNNDFDSVAPVIAGWVERSNSHHAHVHFASPALSWRENFRTRILMETDRVSFSDIWQPPSTSARFLQRHWESNKPDRRLQRRLLEAATELATISNPRRFRDQIAAFKPDIVAFDHYDVPSKRRYAGPFGYQEALQYAIANALPLVSLPHGLLLFRHASERISSISTPYDTVFVESPARAEVMARALLTPTRILISGAPRYDAAWVNRIRTGLTSDQNGRNKNGLLRIVFFANTAKEYFDFSELLRWLALVASNKDTELVIQPHPRGQKVADFAPLAHLGNVIIDTRTPASALIANSDIVSTLVSSVVVEAAMLGREILYPRYISSAQTAFDLCGACIAVESPEHTLPLLDAYAMGKRVPRKNYQRFIERSVYGGRGPNTIMNVVGEMESIIKEKLLSYE